MHNIHRKTPVLGSLFNKAAGLKVCNFIKKKFQHVFFPVNKAKCLTIAFFYRTPSLAASVCSGQCAHPTQKSEVALFSIDHLPCF